MLYKHNIFSRLKRVDDITTKRYTKPTALFIIKKLDSRYHINNFTDDVVICDDLDKYYKDNNINTSDKNTHIVLIEECKNRTIQDILGG